MHIIIRTPCEWTLSDYVPKVRRKLVQELHDNKGYNQKQIAKALGISQPRVSQYLKDEKKNIRNMEKQQHEVMENQVNDTVNDTVYEIIQYLDSGSKVAETIPLVCKGCRELRQGSGLCTMHRYDYPDINDVFPADKNCDLCLHWPKSPVDSPESESLNSRFSILKLLESISSMLILKVNFVDFIPQIGAQLCSIFEGPDDDSLKNIAGFPGRIIQVQGRAKIVSRPEFNASITAGTFLMAIRETNKNITSVLCIKNKQDPDFESTIKKNNFKIFYTEALDENGIHNQIEHEKYADISKLAIIDSGSVGYESISYLFVDNINDLVEIFD